VLAIRPVEPSLSGG